MRVSSCFWKFHECFSPRSDDTNTNDPKAYMHDKFGALSVLDTTRIQFQASIWSEILSNHDVVHDSNFREQRSQLKLQVPEESYNGQGFAIDLQGNAERARPAPEQLFHPSECETNLFHHLPYRRLLSLTQENCWASKVLETIGKTRTEHKRRPFRAGARSKG
ncbi:hypothetical protein BV22DRAFT_447776 [Leucogyrophana mollusca]|uniref:Uncharacterized protein n=1 Tax=Leucogyrophana mollusca TaxID=85980 RepID=A0ACB8BIW5_9AGAM|nr:hypothetical protein BV22DRAFT_447776 [Leucogyrophana mollusca]